MVLEKKYCGGCFLNNYLKRDVHILKVVVVVVGFTNGCKDPVFSGCNHVNSFIPNIQSVITQILSKSSPEKEARTMLRHFEHTQKNPPNVGFIQCTEGLCGQDEHLDSAQPGLGVLVLDA